MGFLETISCCSRKGAFSRFVLPIANAAAGYAHWLARGLSRRDDGMNENFAIESQNYMITLRVLEYLLWYKVTLISFISVQKK